MSEQTSVDGPIIDDCLRLLARRTVPNGQRQLYQVLVQAGPKGATTQELVSKMGRRDEKDLHGVLGALGHRINGTPGYGATHEPGISMILQISKANGGWRYRLKAVMRDALEAHAPSWLVSSADAKAQRLVAFVRSRFPGWNGFEDPRFNGGQLDEVDYKLATRAKALDALSEDALSKLLDVRDPDGFIDRLISIGSDNNFLWQPKAKIGDLSLLHHDGLDRPTFCDAFFDLLYGNGDTPGRLDRYVRWVSSQGLDSMNRWTLPTFYLFFLDSDNEIFVKPTATRNLLKLGGWEIQFDPKPTGDDYARIRDAYCELRESLAEYGPRHMIDVQSFGWVAQEEAERRRRARQLAQDEGFVLDSGVENTIQEFERTVDAAKLIDQAARIEQARRDFSETFGTATRLESLSPEAFFDFFNGVDARGGSRGIFSLNVPFSKDPATPTNQQLQEDLPTLKEAFTRLLHGGGTPAESIDAMWATGSGVKNYVAEGLTIASALLFIQNPERASGVLPMAKKEEKLRAVRRMPEMPKTATLGERFEAFEQALLEMPEKYGRQWTPEVRKEFYFSKVNLHGKNGVNDTNSHPPKPSFGDLIEKLRQKDLHFSTEAVANYILALQAKRFAILTGISGTGKTQIAMRVADSFKPTIRKRQMRMPVDVAARGEVTKMVAQPSHFRFRQIILPAAFVSRIDPFLQPPEGSASGEIEVEFPKGTAKVGYRRDHTRNLTRLVFGRVLDFRSWYEENLQPGDEFFVRLLESAETGEQGLSFSLPKTEETEEVTRELDNSRVVPVRPDWVDNRGLLGYLNPITGAYSMTPFLSLLLEAQEEETRAGKEGRHPHPFFVVLDEMNLARVEHYFSDFLSALESDEPIPLHGDEAIEDGSAESGVPVPRQLRVPKNVFFTGTVNVDETTYMFSPKVLDRAFTIEFDRVDLPGYTDGVARDESGDLDLSAGRDGALRFTPYEKPDRDDWLEFTEIARGRYARILLELHGILEEEHRHFGYRVANEIARFVNLAREQSVNGDESVKAAFDLALLQKVLPKFHGTQQELESVLERLFDFAVHGGERKRGDTDVRLDNWMVVNGRLRPNGKTAARTGVPAGTSQGEADGATGETEETGSENGTDAGDGAADRPDPEFPRTAAKIWRMLRRLQQRGFTAFIE